MTTQFYQRCILPEWHSGQHAFADAADDSIAMIGYCVAGQYRDCTHIQEDFGRCECTCEVCGLKDCTCCTCGRTDPHEHDDKDDCVHTFTIRRRDGAICGKCGLIEFGRDIDREKHDGHEMWLELSPMLNYRGV